jgi:hypothetical protein
MTFEKLVLRFLQLLLIIHFHKELTEYDGTTEIYEELLKDTQKWSKSH